MSSIRSFDTFLSSIFAGNLEEEILTIICVTMYCKYPRSFIMLQKYTSNYKVQYQINSNRFVWFHEIEMLHNNTYLNSTKILLIRILLVEPVPYWEH